MKPRGRAGRATVLCQHGKKDAKVTLSVNPCSAATDGAITPDRRQDALSHSSRLTLPTADALNAHIVGAREAFVGVYQS